MERATSPSNGVLRYDGKKNSNIHITVSSSFTGANGSIYEIAIAKNGTVEPASAMQIQAGGQNASKSLNTSAIEDIQPGDTISLQVRNLSDTNDATFQAYALNYLGM